MTPERTTCPICNAKDMGIYLDPTVGGTSRWLYCRDCGFKGDTLALIKKMGNFPDISAAMRHGIDAGLCSVEEATIDPREVDVYTQYYVDTRAQADKLWEAFQNETESSTPKSDIIEKVQREHLWGGWRHGYQSRMTPLMGAALRGDVNKAFGYEVLPKKGFKAVLVMKYQDVPGRISSFGFVGDGGEQIIHSIGPFTEHHDGGIAMLESLRSYEPVVFAVNDPVLAWQLHKRQFIDSDEMLKVVCYNSNTARAWTSVNADRVILWSAEINAELFRHARLINRAYITTVPKAVDRERVIEQLAKHPISHFTAMMKNHALPWMKFLAGWIANESVRDGQIYEVLDSLELETGEREKLLAECEPSQRVRVEHYLGNKPRSVRTATISRSSVVDRGDGWRIVHRLKGEEVICDASIRVFNEIHNRATSTTYWRGEIVYKGRTVAFTDPVSLIEKDPGRWLNDRTANAGMGCPIFNKNWSRHFLTLCKTFNDPKVVEMSSRLGVLEDGSIALPKFRLVEGAVSRDVYFLDTAVMPGMRVHEPVSRALRDSDKTFPARSAYIALGCAFIANWIAVGRLLQPLPIVAAGGAGSVVRSAAEHLQRSADMRKFMLARGTDKEVLEIRGEIAKYNYTSFIETQAAGALREYPVKNFDNILVCAEPIEASALTCSHPWIMVLAPRLRQDRETLPPFDDFLFYLMDLQSRKFALPECVYIVDAVLEDFCKWYSKHLGINQDATFIEARQMLSVPMWPGRNLVDLCCSLKRDGFIDVEITAKAWEETAIRNERVAVLIDPISNRVFVSRPYLTQALRRAKLPLPVLGEITRDLLDRKILIESRSGIDGWILPKDFWDAQVSSWQSRTCS